MVLFIASLLVGSNYVSQRAYDVVSEAALRKVASGLPSLPRFKAVNFDNS